MTGVRFNFCRYSIIEVANAPIAIDRSIAESQLSIALDFAFN